MDSRNNRNHLIGDTILSWQASADERHLEALLNMAGHIIQQTARAVLMRHGVADPEAVEDAVTLVLDHLRRLPGASADERQVAQFQPRRSPEGQDPGVSYIVWLSKERARDVARRRRSRARRVQPLAEIESAGSLTPIQDLIASAGPDADTLSQLYRAIDGLNPRQAFVIQMLITGQSQATIAAKLNVCEGTVSRLRSTAIAKLREALLAK